MYYSLVEQFLSNNGTTYSASVNKMDTSTPASVYH